MRKVILYIASSLDGYIAKENNDLDWLGIVNDPPEDYGYHDFVNTVDTVIMGRKTYDKVLGFGIEFPHKDRKCYVISRTKTGNDENVTFYNGDIKSLIDDLLQQQGKDIFIDGGAEIVNELMKLGLIDKYIISIIPVFLGSGISLFQNGRPQMQLKLLRSSTFPSGLTQLWYEHKGDA